MSTIFDPNSMNFVTRLMVTGGMSKSKEEKWSIERGQFCIDKPVDETICVSVVQSANKRASTQQVRDEEKS